MIGHSSDLSTAMSAVPFVAMAAQVGFDLSTGEGDRGKNAGINLYKNLMTSSGTIYSLVTGYSHIGFTLAFTGVAIFGMELDYFIDAVKSEQAENVSATPDWLEGAWGSAHYDGEGGTFSGFHTYATRITIIDDHRLMYEVYYYQDYYHPEFSYGQDYAYEREYTYDPDTETVLIPRTDTGVIVGKIYDWSGTSMEKDHLDPLKIQRTPDKDHLTDHVSARFTFDPMELTGKDTERDGNLHFKMNDEDIKYGTMPVL